LYLSRTLATSGILRLTYTFVTLVDNKLYSPTKKSKRNPLAYTKKNTHYMVFNYSK
jgi:hypothetical protein